MKSNMKRFLGLLLATLMVVTMVPTVAFADNTTEGSPNVFSIVTDATGVQQTQYLFVDTLTQNGVTYYGLMSRNAVHNWYPAKTLSGAGDNMGWIDDTTQTSTSSVVYKKLVAKHKGTNLKTLGEYLDTFFPASVVPYVGTLEHQISVYKNVTYKTVDSVTIPTWDILNANKEFVYLGGSNDQNYNGTITRANAGWMDGADWLKAMRPNYSSCHGQMNTSRYNYHWHPLIYVTKDFFKNIKIDTTKEIGANVKTFMSENFNTLDVANAGYTAEEIEALGVNSFKQEVKPETISGNSFTYGGYTYVFIEDAVEEVDGKKYYGVVEKAGLRHNNSWGAIRYDLDAEKSDENTTYVKVGPASPWGGSWANSKATYDMQEETTRTFAPLASYLLDRDWTIKGSWDWNNQGTVTPLVMSGKIGIPTEVQFKNAINAGDLTLTVGAYHLNGLYYYAEDNYTYHERVNTSGSSDRNLRIALTPSATNIVWSGGKVNGEFFFMGYVSEDFFKLNKIDATTIGSGAKTFLKSEFTRDELTGWTNDNLDILFGGYEGEGLGIEIVNGTSVIVHNNGAEAAGKGALVIIASYDADGMIDVKTLTLDAAVGANSKTSALSFDLDTTGATSVKAMLWEDLLNAKPLTNAAFAN